MKLSEQLHKSKFHRQGFEPNCPKCLKDKGIDGIIRHLRECATQNDKDSGTETCFVAGEQRRMIGILSLLQKATKC